MIVVAVWILLMVSGYANMRLREYDDFQIVPVILFGVYSWDFFSDIFFVSNIFQDREPTAFTVFLFAASSLFIVVPVLKGFSDLVRAQKEWLESEVMRDRYSRWWDEYGTILYLLSFACGSTFSAVDVMNSNLFGTRLFGMGLMQEDLRNFNRHRLFSVVLFENFPQLIIQILYAAFVEQGEVGAVSLTAMVSSALSIVVAVLDYISTERVRKMEKNQCLFPEVMVGSEEATFVERRGVLSHKTVALRQLLPAIFDRHVNDVEILWVRSSTQPNGREVLFLDILISSTNEKMTVDEMRRKWEENDFQALKKQIGKAWGLDPKSLTVEGKEPELRKSISKPTATNQAGRTTTGTMSVGHAAEGSTGPLRITSGFCTLFLCLFFESSVHRQI